MPKFIGPAYPLPPEEPTLGTPTVEPPLPEEREARLGAPYKGLPDPLA